MNGSADTEPALPAASSNRGLWVGLVLGGPLVAVGVAGALADADLTRPAELAAWVVGSALVHDLVLVPVVLLVGTALRRWLPGSISGPACWAAATSGVLVLCSWPFVRGWGRSASNPSLLPRNYAVGLAAYLVAVWLVAATVVLVLALLRSGHRSSPKRSR